MKDRQPSPCDFPASLSGAVLPADRLSERLAALCDLASAAIEGCHWRLRWESSVGGGAFGSKVTDPLVSAVLPSVERELDFRLSGSTADPPTAAGKPRELAWFELRPTDLALLAAERGRDFGKARAIACAYQEPDLRLSVAVVDRGTRSSSKLKAIVKIIAKAALAELENDRLSSLRSFWLARATDNADALAHAHRELARITDLSRELDRSVARATALKPPGRFRSLGALIAGEGGFDRWIMAAAREGALDAVAVSTGFGPVPALDERSAMARSLKERRSILGPSETSRGGRFREDRLFPGYYLCVPFEAGVIALGSDQPVTRARRKRVEALLGRIGYLVRIWTMEAEAEQRRALLRRIALRMFAAIDEERARIARDLHDDQAQLLAAARIALEAGPAKARGVLRQLEQELRHRMHHLRPARLGSLTLAEALRHELGLLGQAGIRCRLIGARAEARMSRGARQLCFQVAREALANVVRHSHASEVEVEIRCARGVAQITVTDNGRGIRSASGDEGFGISGLKERLELMGGSLRLETSRGSTRLSAEIPEPAG